MPPRLLGAFDPWLLGWRSREHAVPAEHGRTVHPGGGMVRAVATADGTVVGTWTAPRGVVAIEPFAPLEPAVARALERDAAAVERFLGAGAGRTIGHPCQGAPVADDPEIARDDRDRAADRRDEQARHRDRDAATRDMAAAVRDGLAEDDSEMGIGTRAKARADRRSPPPRTGARPRPTGAPRPTTARPAGRSATRRHPTAD